MEVVTRGKTITAEEWLAWRMSGQSTEEIAARLGVSPSMVRNIARRFRSYGYDDPLYRKHASGLSLPDPESDRGAYLLGLLWGVSSFNDDEGFLIRHRDPRFVDTVRDLLGVEPHLQRCTSGTGRQARLKISGYQAGRLRDFLTRYGWSPRQASVRVYPREKVNDRGFIRAWVELHSSADIARTGRGRHPIPRLRIYGNRSFIETVSTILGNGAGVGPRKVQKTCNRITSALYYTGKNYSHVLDWLYDGADICNERIHLKFLGVESEEAR